MLLKLYYAGCTLATVGLIATCVNLPPFIWKDITARRDPIGNRERLQKQWDEHRRKEEEEENNNNKPNIYMYSE
jgi:hypothetical protein